jgi:hypothetical protein
MYKLKKIGKVFTSKFVGTGPSYYEKRIYRATVSQRLRNAALEDVSTSLVVGWLSFLICILEVPGSNLGHDNN